VWKNNEMSVNIMKRRYLIFFAFLWLLLLIPVISTTEPNCNEYSFIVTEINQQRITDLSTPISLASETLSVNVTLNATRVVRGTPIGINVTITDNDTRVRVSNITMFYAQGNVEYNLTDFQEMEKGVYYTSLNTTSLSRGWWKVTIQVDKGKTTQFAETRFAVVVSLKKREYPSPIFLTLIILSTVLLTSAILIASRKLDHPNEEYLDNEDIW